jgi:hypothetical protein
MTLKTTTEYIQQRKRFYIQMADIQLTFNFANLITIK